MSCNVDAHKAEMHVRCTKAKCNKQAINTKSTGHKIKFRAAQETYKSFSVKYKIVGDTTFGNRVQPSTRCTRSVNWSAELTDMTY